MSEESFEQHAKSVVERSMVLGAARYRIEVVAPALQRMIDHCAKIGNQLMAEHSKVSDEFDVLWESILKFSKEVCDVEEVL